MGIKEILALALVLGMISLFSNKDMSWTNGSEEARESGEDSATQNIVEDSSKFRRINFSNYTWLVKTGRQRTDGLRPNYFSDSKENVWVDDKGQLHLKIIKRNGRWYCAEIVSEKSFGYGRYIFYLASRIDQLDKNVVLGLFTWDNSPRYNHREIDIEFARWGKREGKNAQFVVQPWTRYGNTHQFNAQLKGDCSTYSFGWRKESISFQGLRGHYSTPPDNNYVIELWNYTGRSIPPCGNEKTRINLWLSEGKAPSNKMEVEVVIKKFEFIP